MAEMNTCLSKASVTAQLQAAVGWEAKNRVLVQLARDLPGLPEAARCEQNRVSGCESRVWVQWTWQEGKLVLQADSDSRVIQGLLMLVYACFNGQDAQTILNFDFESWVSELGLMRFLTATRGNGLRAIVARVREAAQQSV